MLCIFCFEERAPSLEHVLPLAIGGTITTDRVCQECNSALGTRVDAALSDFLPMRMRRAKLGLAGNKGAPPASYEIFLGEAKVIGQAADRVQITFNKATGKLDTRQLYHAANIETPDGKKLRQITIDARDKNQIPKIIQRERKRHGLPPLSDDELAAAANSYTTNEVRNPLIQRPLTVSFAYLRHAMIKIAYELAFLWLGEAYLTDPLAIELRAAVCDPDVASTDNVVGYIGEATDNCDIFNKFWIPHEEHHLAYALIYPCNDIVICVRVFDIYAAAVVVSHDHRRYVSNVADHAKLRFLAIDSTTGRTIDTTFNEESRRLLAEMRLSGHPLPVADPLTPLTKRKDIADAPC
jgi:hypothetical protein